MTNNLTDIPFGLPGKIYRSPLPNGSFDYGLTTLDEMLAAEVSKVVVLVEEFEWRQRANVDLPALYQENNIEILHYPVSDFNVPTDLESYLEAVQQVIIWARSGENIAIHCFAGIGRTGTFLTAMAVDIFGWNPLEAVFWIRQFIPGAVENETQLKFVMQSLQ
ncbi:MAG: dual specificity protein phosphatase family protein [Anaerolineaceae bacterium]|nr:dual specificity protein phosphatase family protein [Anaerolineaceae bacterium]